LVEARALGARDREFESPLPDQIFWRAMGLGQRVREETIFHPGILFTGEFFLRREVEFLLAQGSNLWHLRTSLYERTPDFGVLQPQIAKRAITAT
jgi:hypothetical protein